MKTVDWYKAFKGDRRSLPGSQGQGITLVQSLIVPLQAYISLITGRYVADLRSLREYANSRGSTICESCCSPLSRNGEGHEAAQCSLYQRAIEVLNSDEDAEKNWLKTEKKRHVKRISQIDSKLARHDAE